MSLIRSTDSNVCVFLCAFVKNSTPPTLRRYLPNNVRQQKILRHVFCGTFLLNTLGSSGLFITFQDGAFVKACRETSLLALRGFPRLGGLFEI